MTAAHKDKLVFDYKELANAIIANTQNAPDPFTYHPEVHEPKLDARSMVMQSRPSIPGISGRSLKVGPFEVRPALNQEVPIGRGYQPVPVNSMSRLAAYLGRDEYSLYIREVMEDPANGLRPSKNGVWVRDAGDNQYRRLAPGEAARINADTEVRLGGNGKDGHTGYRVHVI
jgi:hypothetical protein